jgi:hypothetical protein
MQLRVARLCLDCEELHADKRCPRCASASFAFVTNWLPCEERRRFGRNRTPAGDTAWRFSVVLQSVARWFRGNVSRAAPATRRSDFVPELRKLDELAESPRRAPGAHPHIAVESSTELQLANRREHRVHESSPAADA